MTVQPPSLVTFLLLCLNTARIRLLKLSSPGDKLCDKFGFTLLVICNIVTLFGLSYKEHYLRLMTYLFAFIKIEMKIIFIFKDKSGYFKVEITLQ